MAKTTAQMLPPVHPGEILREEFLLPLGLSAGALARRIGVPRTRIERVVKEETPITTDTALRLAKVVEAFAPRSSFDSICGNDFSAPLRSMAKKIVATALTNVCAQP